MSRNLLTTAVSRSFCSLLKELIKEMSPQNMPKGQWEDVKAYLYSHSISGLEGEYHVPAALPLGKDSRYLLYRRMGGPRCWNRCLRKISPFIGTRIPDRPARSVVVILTALSLLLEGFSICYNFITVERNLWREGESFYLLDNKISCS